MDDQKLFQCPECGLHYTDQKIAQACEAWCKEHKSCNLLIMQQSIEVLQNQKNNK